MDPQRPYGSKRNMTHNTHQDSLDCISVIPRLFTGKSYKDNNIPIQKLLDTQYTLGIGCSTRVTLQDVRI